MKNAEALCHKIDYGGDIKIRLDKGTISAAAAQVSQEQFDKIMFLINKGREEGAKLEVGGERYGGLPCTNIPSLLAAMLHEEP